jgi:hypothetical protein
VTVLSPNRLKHQVSVGVTLKLGVQTPRHSLQDTKIIEQSARLGRDAQALIVPDHSPSTSAYFYPYLFNFKRDVE